MNQKPYRVLRLAWLICALILCLSPSLMAAPGKQEEASRFFQEGKYPEAIRIWEEMAGQGYGGAGVYYNMGLAESRLGHTSAAILAFENALRYKPNQRAIRDALVSERKKIEDSTIPVPPFFLSEWYREFLAWFRPGYWAILGLLIPGIMVMDLLAVSLRITKKNLFGRRLRWIALLTGLFCLIAAGLRFADMYRADEFIITTECRIHQAPDPESPVSRVLHPGEKIRKLDQIGEWYRISMLNLDEGWCQLNAVTPVMPVPTR